jgi:hypothetical protein
VIYSKQNLPLYYSSLLVVLNILRTNDYDYLPSRSYSYSKSENSSDFSYQQQIELKILLRSPHKSPISFLMLSDHIYDYGEQVYEVDKIEIMKF